MSGGGGSTTTKADPWSGVQPYLSGLFQDAGDLYNNKGPAPNNTQMSGATTAAINQAIANGTGQDPTMNNTLNQLQWFANSGNTEKVDPYSDQSFNSSSLAQSLNSNAAGLAASNANDATANGAYLNANPYVDQMYNTQADAVTKNFQQSTLPGLLSAYSSAGRYGSGANDAAIGQASDSLGTTLNGLAANTYGTNYANERVLQQQAQTNNKNLYTNMLNGNAQLRAGLGGQAAQRDLSIQQNAIGAIPNLTGTNLQNLVSAGGLLDANAQANNPYNMQYARLLNLSQLLQPGIGAGGQTQTSTPGPSTFSKVGTGALSGAATGAAVGSVVPGIGTAIGAGVGAIGGAIFGAM